MLSQSEPASLPSEAARASAPGRKERQSIDRRAESTDQCAPAAASLAPAPVALTGRASQTTPISATNNTADA